MKPLFDKLLPALGLAALAVAWAVVVGVFSGPALLDAIESWADATLTYEQSIRATVMLTFTAFMMLWIAHLPRKVTPSRLAAFVAVILAYISIAIVAWFDSDPEHTLMDEFSWIRYATAFFLVASAVVGAAIARHYAREGNARQHTVLWVVLSIAFLGLAGDEIFMFHEAIGTWMTDRGGSHLATDLVTTSYAVVALLLVVVLARNRAYLQEYIVGHPNFVTLFTVATLVFLVGQIGDTLDMLTHAQLVKMGAARAAEGGLFPDFWYPLWGPKQFMNGVEEVFEGIASTLFFAGFIVLWLERRSPGLRDRVLSSHPGRARVLTTIVLVVGLLLTFVLARGRFIDSPVKGHDAVLLVGPQHGLFHSDVVFYHPHWGLLIANEGGGNIVRYQNGAIDSLPDPQGLVSDTDCVTATDQAIYVSSPSLDTIFEYTEANGYRPLVTAEHGLRDPEALVIVDSTMYVADETNHQIYVIDMATRSVRKWPLDNIRWSNPEGITYHPDLERILFTDDVWGSLATVDMEGQIDLFAYYTEGLVSPEDVCVTSDGRIFVADNGRREVIEFATDGTVVNRIRMHRMHSYLVGVAVIEASEPGEKDRLYVTTSDGYMSLSFMPSLMWEMELPSAP